jgi:putative tryptophan/tyrosine transport system substrate-binding protein
MNLRRSALALIPVLGVVLTCGSSAAQQEDKIPRVGIIINAGPAFDAFRKGLGQLDYVEGRNIVIEVRFAHGQLDRVPDFVAELVRLDVDIIVAAGAVAARAAQKATTKIPIVFAAVLDPVSVGFAVSLERPGGNITGITSFDPQQSKKQFEMLKEVIPKLARVAILGDQGVPDALEKVNDVEARALGLQPQTLNVKGPNPDLEGAFAAMTNERAEALLILDQPATIAHQKRIAELAATHRLPTIFPGGWGSANAGGLIAYGTSFLDTLPGTAKYIHKILKGARPADLPIEVITQGELVFNLKTAQAIGVTIPPELLKRATKVIE